MSKRESQKIVYAWNKNYNSQGVKPPFTNVVPIGTESASYTLNHQKISNPYTIYQELSFRDPYRTQLLINPYGQVQTRVGTNLGMN